MKQVRKARSLIVLIAIGVLVFLLARCMPEAAMAPDPRGGEYAGSQTCAACHPQAAASGIAALHAHSSGKAGAVISHLAPAASFPFAAGDTVHVRVRADSLMQVREHTGRPMESFTAGLYFGSGKRAFTFAYWQGDRLFQLPLSYFTSHGAWANSPGFPADQPYFGRSIVSRCFECHASFAGTTVETAAGFKRTEHYSTGSLITGIDCERCHGPAAKHVRFHQSDPGRKRAAHISRYSELSRAQRLDACAVCHSGNNQPMVRSTFSFVPGDVLKDYQAPAFGEYGAQHADVHGKQSDLLAQSRCFQGSKLECQSCHTMHDKPKTMRAYTQVCSSCHPQPKHSTGLHAGRLTMGKDCIDCHMPLQPSKVISFQLAGKKTKSSYLLRTHKIAVYR
ncbi:hypothetical protein [Pedobacter sp. SYP-B3415]|uniref:hypothetical protein n=1 Tax=Pedobacter sp. SYP-B3415 TaxID=2496641 RepID=UPI00101CE0B7|nr:hypothetical protein [Pedobacter sp. SYP-B3415]